MNGSVATAPAPAPAPATAEVTQEDINMLITTITEVIKKYGAEKTRQAVTTALAQALEAAPAPAPAEGPVA